MKLDVSFQKVRWYGVLVAAILMGAGWNPARAARMEVADGDVAGLIAAVKAANDEMANPGEDVIVLASGGSYVLSGVYGEPRNQTGLPAITSDIRIVGNRTAISREPWPGMVNMFRFFTVGVGGGLTLDNLVLEGGYAVNGGAIYNTNYLVLKDVVLRNNRAMSGGGAIYNFNNSWVEVIRGELLGNVTEGSAGGAVFNRLGYAGLFDSTLTANQALMGTGGALHAMRYAQTVVDGCTFDGNQSRFEGGAIHNYNNAFLQVVNTTFSGNRAESYGGAVANTALLPNMTMDGATSVIVFSTLVDNRAETGGAAIYAAGDDNDAVAVTVVGGLVASSAEVVSQCEGGVLIIADDSSLATDSTCGNAMFAPYVNLRLMPLAFNGGPTRTHALLPGSTAIDWPFTLGVAGRPEFDQRCITRSQDGDGNTFRIADAGAFEHETLIRIDVSPKDAASTVRLSRDQVDVLVLKGSAGLDVAALTAADMVGAQIAFGDGHAAPVMDLTKAKQLANHQTAEGLLLHFFVAQTGLDAADQMGCLTMYFADGRTFRGCDGVMVVP